VSPEPTIRFRILEEGDDLLEFLLGLIDPGDIIESRLYVGLGEYPGFALGHRHRRIANRTHPAARKQKRNQK
jgi:hypothetical protein